MQSFQWAAGSLVLGSAERGGRQGRLAGLGLRERGLSRPCTSDKPGAIAQEVGFYRRRLGKHRGRSRRNRRELPQPVTAPGVIPEGADSIPEHSEYQPPDMSDPRGDGLDARTSQRLRRPSRKDGSRQTMPVAKFYDIRMSLFPSMSIILTPTRFRMQWAKRPLRKRPADLFSLNSDRYSR